MNDETQLILEFYKGTGTDHMGRRLETILRKGYRWLEQSHDYIQGLFPLYLGSQFNPNAPILTDEVRDIFNTPSHPDYLGFWNEAVILP